MNNEKLLRDIGLDLETFQAHIKRMRKNPDNLHALDIDLLQEKTRKIYNKLFELENPEASTKAFIPRPVVEAAPKPEVVEQETVTVEEIEIEKNPEPEIIADVREPEPKEEILQEVVEEENILKEEVEAEIIVEKIAEEIIETEPEPKVQNNEPVFVEEKVVVERFEEQTVENEQVPEKVQDSKQQIRSAIDLFSGNTEETIGDKLGNTNDSSIAERMQESQIEDLKQAIGINEKFLFINGLFNGDLGRYNKAIDEFNELKTKEGIDTHLLELKVHNQWADDNEAFQKIKTLLDRKFN